MRFLFTLKLLCFFGLMASTNAKVTPLFNACHKFFINDFVSQMERKTKDNLEKRRKEKKEQRYKDKERMFDEY